ncbi:MAG TPA: hypothetical protein VFT01_08490 [Homoserinimonas sp.]|nr:hypothetical protein [Homoserinimonas sp.]
MPILDAKARGLGTTLAAVGLAAGLIAMAGLTSAHAAAGAVEVSPDGITYGSSYPGTLFDSIGHLVPGDSEQETFYLRNAGTEAGFLRITLTDVVAADADFADALTVSASTVDQAGIAATVSQAQPCWVLHEGQKVMPGETVPVTTELALANLDGTAGQGATAGLSFEVTLSSAAAQLPPTSCGRPGITVPVTPAPRPSVPVTPGTPGTPALADSPATTPRVPDSSTDLPVLNIPELLGIDPNTWRLFEEYFVLLLIGAFTIGAAWFAFVAWRRRKNEAEPESDEQEAVVG